MRRFRRGVEEEVVGPVIEVHQRPRRRQRLAVHAAAHVQHQDATVQLIPAEAIAGPLLSPVADRFDHRPVVVDNEIQDRIHNVVFALRQHSRAGFAAFAHVSWPRDSRAGGCKLESRCRDHIRVDESS